MTTKADDVENESSPEFQETSRVSPDGAEGVDEWGWEIAPVPFSFEWRGRVWEGLADINDPPTSILSIITATQMPQYTAKARVQRNVKSMIAIIDFLEGIIVEWNYVDRRGNELEINAQTLASLPGDLLAQTFNEIIGLITEAPKE